MSSRKRNYSALYSFPGPAIAKRRRLVVPRRTSNAAQTAPSVTSFKNFSAARRRLARTGGYLGIEKKFLDTASDNLTILAPTDCSSGEMQPTTGCTGCLNCPARGDGPSERDGQKITIRSVYVNGVVTVAGASDLADVPLPPHVFVALVLDTQANGVTINSEDIFLNPGSAAVFNGHPLRALANSSRFRVLAHTTLNMGPFTAATDGSATCSVGGQMRKFQFSYRKPFICNLSGTTADVANVKDNSLHIVAYATATDMYPNLSYQCRVRFVG